MKRLFVLLLALVVLSPPFALARTKLTALPDKDAVSVRFDNPSATLIEEQRVLALQEGENNVDFSWNGVSIDPDSIRLSFVDDSSGVVLLSVSYPPGESALVWRIHAKKAVEARAKISYLLSNIDSLVAYKGVASKDEKTLSLNAYLVLRNFSGEDFPKADFHLGLDKPVTDGVVHEETKHILFMNNSGIPIRKVFTWDSARQPWEPKRENSTAGIPVEYVLSNTKESGLGKNILWRGKFRIFQDDGHGSTIFLGENTSNVTPVGEELKIYIGDSREISVTQRKVLDERKNYRPNRSARVQLYDTNEMINTFVENFKDEKVVVNVVQHIPGQWDMEEATHKFERKDSTTLVFPVEVPAKGKAEMSITYHRRNVRN